VRDRAHHQENKEIVMTSGMKSVVFPVKDLSKAKELYTALLGTPPYADEAYYVGFRVEDLEVGLDPNGHRQGLTGPVGYWDVDDIHAAVKQLLSAGAQEQQAPMDVGGGALIARVTDADGNVIGLRQTP
jgi:predicted enzyme related to lactoylglutathione lyase